MESDDWAITECVHRYRRRCLDQKRRPSLRGAVRSSLNELGYRLKHPQEMALRYLSRSLPMGSTLNDEAFKNIKRIIKLGEHNAT